MNDQVLKHVSILGFKKALGTSITISMEMLNAADLIKRIDGSGYQKLTMDVINLDEGNISLTAGLEIVSKVKLRDINHTDLIIIPALWGNPKGVVKKYPQLKAWLQQQSQQGCLICAIGTGSYFLAEAGLLNNKVATTHWYYFDQFSEQYPQVHLQRDRFITQTGQLYCTGSVNSVRDVMLHFIESFYNPTIANQVSQHFSHEIKQSYHSLYFKNSPQRLHDDESIIEIQEWMHTCFNQDIRLTIISDRFSISIRSLNRRFKHATGKSPMQYLQQIRIDNAKELLKTSNLSIVEVAYQVGYQDSSYFSALFRKTISISPKEYRRMVRKKLFKVDT